MEENFEERFPPDWFVRSPHRPEDATHGEKSQDILYIGVGKCCSQWEILEDELLHLFMRLLHFNEPNNINLATPLSIYGSIIGSGTRSDLIKELSRLHFRSSSVGRTIIQDLITDVRRAAGRRNELVHGIVLSHSAPDIITGGYFLGPPLYAIKKHDSDAAIGFPTPKYRYNSTSISEIFWLLNDLTSIVLKLTNILDNLTQRASLQKPLSQAEKENKLKRLKILVKQPMPFVP